MKLTQRLKNLVAAMLLVVGVALPAAMFIMDVFAVGDPFLHIGGVELVYHEDGSVQAIFDVEIRNLETFSGASFFLDYNPKYLIPSDINTNQPLKGNGIVSSTAFVRVDAGLYGGDSPFVERPAAYNNWTSVFNSFAGVNLHADYHYVAVNLTLRSTAAAKGKVERIKVGEGGDEMAAINTSHHDGRVTLAQMSFRVMPEHLPHIAATFEDIELEKNPRVPPAGEPYDYLLDVLGQEPLAFDNVPEVWQIAYYGDMQETGNFNHTYGPTSHPDNDPDSPVDTAYLRYTFDFPKTLVDLRAMEEELTVDAYQAYTDGTLSDVAAVLRKYSPMAELTFTDDSKEARIIPWGTTDSPYTAADFKVYQYEGRNPDGTLKRNQPVTSYDPTHGEYVVEQYLWITYDRRVRVWGDDPSTPGTETYYYETVTVTERSPEPVLVHLTVTPITLVSVTTDDLHKTYALTENLLSAVREVSALDLPDQARLCTDVPVDGASLLMDIPGWNSSNSGSWPVGATTGRRTIDLLNLWEDTASDGSHHWPTQDDSGRLGEAAVANNRIGVYSFDFADGGIGGATRPGGFTQSEIQTKYPWLTVPEPNYPVGPATRTIVAESEAPRAYTVTYVSTATDSDGDPVLTLQVERADGSVMELGSKFRVLLPDGTPLGVGNANADTTGPDEWDSWFDEKTGSGYHAARQPGDRTYHLVTDPGPMDSTGTYGVQRTNLRRHINLGGWFYVAINEKETPERAWTDYIPVYVPPRDNLHMEDKTYNFIGENAGLFRYPGGVSTTFTVPPGDYTPVSDVGEPLYESDNTTRVREEFGARTTYDGLTGLEPGRLHTLQMTNDAANVWLGPTNEGVPATGPLSAAGKNVSLYRYGASEFVDGATYPNFGLVKNTYNKKGTLRRETGEDNPTQVEKISLKYVPGSSNFGSENNAHGADGNLELSTYNSRRWGYTMRQEYTFVIKNEGTTEIFDLGLDLLTDDANSRYDGGGGHFEIIRPPASYLAPGQETTFTMTYVYGLDILTTENPSYLDTIFVTSSTHHKAPGDADYQTGDYTDHLLDFDATFLVSDSDLYEVKVVCKPAAGMGSAGTVVGLLGDGSANNPYAMNLTSGSTTYVEGQRVYVVVRLEDEYTLDDAYPVAYTEDSTGNGQNLSLYPWKDPDDPGDTNAPVPAGEDGEKVMIYYFDMPADDVTVTVTFIENELSKLRLGDLRVYADDVTHPNPDDPGQGAITSTDATIAGPGGYNDMGAYLNKPNGDKFDTTGDHTAQYNGNSVNSRDQKFKQRIFAKTFTDAEKAAAKASGNEGRYLSTVGRADVQGFDSSRNQYLVVIPADAEYAEVTARLRQVALLSATNEGLTDVTVQMTLYDAFNGPDTSIHAANAVGYTNASKSGENDGPTTHYSIVFDAPRPNHSRYAQITVSTSGTQGGTTVYRYYYVEIHRMGDDLLADLNYGNSPYGMIMNADNITGSSTVNLVTKTNKQWAKEAFVSNNYSFRGLSGGSVPAAVDARMQAIRYHTEAWVKVPPSSLTTYKPLDTGTRYEPESFTDLTHYLPANNLDLDDYALFVYGGSQALVDGSVKADTFTDPGVVWGDPALGKFGYNIYDSSGRRVDITTVKRFADVTLLDTAAATQAERFATDGDTETIRLYLGQDLSIYDVPAGWTTVVPKLDASVSPAAQVFENGKPVYELAQAGDPDAITVYIRPGVYKLVYTYPDFDASDPVADPAKERRLPSRNFIILTRTGDVNADGQVVTGDAALGTGTDHSDERYIKDRVTDPLGYMGEGYTDWAVFRYRVCDANNDRNINNIDANELDRAPRLEYYKATDYGFTKPAAAAP